ncbi:hypothetical protein LshimejAT787_1200360 [Lyophyllum shimeji]|uniref:G-protein coupled receptors family 2 profile 2 domain-containing protein n=1 Tax=Lyophyllum shimeji TaxID=47721 RepID=A0A9P3PWK0_LYOSH|nr:hypothetical protein LshimejAT787_1200360 [Lyophyllum shimeji]
MSDGITPSEVDFAGILAYACAIPGTIVCWLVLVAYATVASFRRARKYLDRVSFRLIVQALISHVLFGIAYAVTPIHSGPGCDVAVFFVSITLLFATFYTTSIAINLQLVLVHGINGKKMEKYYVIVTWILSCALCIPTYASGQYGWNEPTQTCWFSNSDDHARLRWLIATQSFWIALAAVIETICSCVVLYWLYRHQRAINSLIRHTTLFDLSTNINGPHHETTWFGSANIVLSRDPGLRKIIIRIVLYPMVSIIFNIGTVALDLHATLTPFESQLDFRLLVLDLILYGSRTLAYGLLAFWDPSFVNAVREVRRSFSLSRSSQSLPNVNFTPMQTIPDGGKRPMHVETQQASSPTEFGIIGVSKALALGGL